MSGPPVRLHHRVDGPEDAPVVVLSGSLGSSIQMWEPQMPALAQRFRVVRYDHRGHGDSPVPEGPYDLDDLSQDVVGLLDDLGLERVHFCGLSLGGMVGMWLAAHAPQRVRRLVACCTSACLGPPEKWRDRAATARAQGMGALADAVVANWFTPRLRERVPTVVERAREMLCATPPEGYAGCCEAIERMDLRPVLGQARAPTLVVAAADDPATPAEHAHEIAAGMPTAEVAVVDGAAHLANIEKPEAVSDLIIRHLAADEEGQR